MRPRYGGFRGYNLTPIWVLLSVNFILFIVYLINDNFLLTNFGLTPYFFSEQPWTILTAMFIHAGVWHILGNMLMLYFFGSFMLGLVGEVKFLTVYFLGGLVGNALFLLIGNDLATAVGASGAIYAIMGTLAVMRPRMKVYVWFLIPVDLWIVVVIGALIISPSIAWQAHIGGLVVGLIAGLYFRMRERRTNIWR